MSREREREMNARAHRHPRTNRYMYGEEGIYMATKMLSHTHTRTHARTHVRTHVRTYARTHARTHTYTHAHARTHTHTHTHISQRVWLLQASRANTESRLRPRIRKARTIIIAN